MPKETKNTIWVVGADGSGKTALITLFPIAALRMDWILLPDESTARHIYGWQHQLFSNGKFPPKGEDQRVDNFSFANLKPDEWKKSQFGNARIQNQRTIAVVEQTMSPEADPKEFEEELAAQLNLDEEFGLIYCLDVMNPDESAVTHLEDIVRVMGDNRSKLPRRLCIAFTKSDMFAHPDHPAYNGHRIFEDEYPRGVQENRRLKLVITPERVLNALVQNDRNGVIGDLRKIISGSGQRKRNDRLETSLEVCTAVGVAKDKEDNYRPNIADSYEGADYVYERQQLWWSGIDRALLRAHGAIFS